MTDATTQAGRTSRVTEAPGEDTPWQPQDAEQPGRPRLRQEVVMKVKVTDAQIRSWRLRGYSLARIASACGTTTSEISRRIQRIWQEQYRPPIDGWGDPRPEQIRQLCEEIQREWSEKERQKRHVGRARSWRPVVVPASILALARD
jgi:hypothetical protein